MFLGDRGFKKRAPRAIKAIKRFAEKQMRTPDVRIDTKLNKAVWSKGVRCVCMHACVCVCVVYVCV